MGLYLCPKIQKPLPTVRIGILREGKNPPDPRVPLTPAQCALVAQQIPGASVVVQASPHRCFTDAEYQSAGITVVENLSDCDVLLGVKEVPVANLLEGKTYLFFSHTKKAQPYNQPLMRALIEKKIRMVDYECLTNKNGDRLLGFGTWAGIVGAHNGLKTWGQRTGELDLPAAYDVHDWSALQELYKTVSLPPIKMVLTGSGRVATGVREVMEDLNIREVSPADFLENTYSEAVFTHLKGGSLYTRRSGGGYDRNEFHARPELYDCLFPPYAKAADILFNGIYWDSKIPRLFSKEAVQSPNWKTAVIADITCDTGGSVPINLGATIIADPVYGVDKASGEKTAPYQNNSGTIDLMAVDTLPAELPRDASEYFGEFLLKDVLPRLAQEGDEAIDRGTICAAGELMPQFGYLAEYAGL